MSATPLEAFSAYGIELEYMLVDRSRLDVRPIADRILPPSGNLATGGLIDCSNELVLHVLEIKNPSPGPLEGLATAFQSQVQQLNARLADLDTCLMPTGMHPWMDPARETTLWPHDEQAIYSTYHHLFNCNRHPWANVQSMHINLPFADDAQFERLLAAVRTLLPILPAIAASSPLADGRPTGYMDTRMQIYADQSPAQPAIVGALVPEVVRSQAEYETSVLAPMFKDIEAVDPAHCLRHEWLNARGAIARFDRNAIEIRVMDTQECPHADVALAALVIDLSHLFYQGELASLEAQQALPTAVLQKLLADCTRDAEWAVIDDAQYLSALGFDGPHCTAQTLWRHLGDVLQNRGAPHLAIWQTHLQFILQQGPLARRIIRALDGDYTHAALHALYAGLVKTLTDGAPFLPR